MQTQARVVIVGGGMMGCGLLYHLAEEGWTDCLLIEKAELTSGSTWHAAGQCPSFIADYSMALIHHHGNTLYPTLEAKTGQYVSWHGCGGIRFATNQDELDWFRQVEGVAKMVGFRMQIVGPDEIRRLNPFVDTTGVIAGAWTLDDGHVDPAGCCNALAKGARDMGAKIQLRTRVTDIRQRPSGEWEVVTEQGTVTCEHVVNAAGCYARLVQHWVGGDAPITNMKHHYLVTDPIPAFTERNEEIPVMRDPYPDAYYRQEQKAGLIGIYETEDVAEAWAERGGSPEWDSENELFTPELDRIAPWVERVMERMPILAEAGVRRIVHGAISHTPDANPLLGPAPGLRNFWMACGASIGIAQGAGCGKYLAQWMVHGQAEINMGGLDPRRFGPWADEDHVRARSFEDYAHMYKLHLPGEERPAGRGRRKTPLHDILAAKGGLHTATAGWERPKYFAPDGKAETPGFRRNDGFAAAAAEAKAVRERVGVADLSSFAKFDVTGPDAAAFLDRIVANRLPKRDGGIALCHFLNEQGHMEGEATVTRLAADRFYVLSGAAAEMRDHDWLVSHVAEGERVEIRNVTDDYGNLLVTGPKAREVLAPLTGADLANAAFRWLAGREIEIAGQPVRALRVSYVGELGWELHAPMASLPALYAAITEAGAAHGVVDFGVYAVNAMRLEKGYRGWGAEMTNEITLIEADMERFFAPDKGEFIGRAATLARKQQGVKIRLVYCAVEDPVDGQALCDAHGGEAVMDGDAVIGITTSGGYGHTVGRSIAFAYVPPSYAEPGSRFDLLLLGERRQATVLKEPLYDPGNERLRG